MNSPDRPFSEVLSNIFGNVEDMFRGELKLVKTEVREEILKASRGAAWTAAGVLSALFAVGFLLVSLFFALLFVIPNWAAAFVIAASMGLVSAITLQVGGSKRRSKQSQASADLAPVHSKENLAWAKHQAK